MKTMQSAERTSLSPAKAGAPVGLPGTVRRLMRVAGMAAALGANAAAWADTAVVDIAWDAAAQFRHDTSIAPGRFVEVCGPLAGGSATRWSFEASGPLDFNVHFHEGKKVVYPEQRRQVDRAEGQLNVRAAQDHCWMWTNRSTAPVELRAVLHR
jgi:hypothetical protein